MNILVLEDNLYSAEMIKEDLELYLTKNNIYANIICCNNVYAANSALKSNTFDFIISDLNMNPNGLKTKYLNETLGAVITGWIWIKYDVLTLSQVPNIIIFSAFINELNKDADYKNKYKNKIPVIEKTDNGNNVKTLGKTLVTMINSKRRFLP